jgi:hypothetical protein
MKKINNNKKPIEMLILYFKMNSTGNKKFIKKPKEESFIIVKLYDEKLLK